MLAVVQSKWIILFAALSAAIVVPQARAETVVLNAVQDTYIRSGTANRGLNFNVDESGLGTHSIIIGGNRFGLFQWDLSSVTENITAAHIEFYASNDPDGDNIGQTINLTSYLVTPPAGVGGSGLDETTMTYTIYTGDVNDHEVALESLGFLMQEGLGADGVNKYYATQAASAADISLLNERRTRPSGEQYAFIFFQTAGGFRWFNGHEDGNAARLVLTTGPVVNGDFDGDGDVDGADFVVWQTNFPTTSGATAGDADGDDDVDGADFAVWQDSFPGSGGGASPVPEPGAYLLAVMALAGLPALRSRRIAHN